MLPSLRLVNAPRLKSKIVEKSLLQYLFALLLEPLHGDGVEQVEHHREDGARRVHPQRHPPEQLFVQFLLEIFQHQQPDREAGERPR